MKTSILSLLLIPFLINVSLSVKSQAVDPEPDGGYERKNTAEGNFALYRLYRGVENTAIGYAALLNDDTGDENSAIGGETLLFTTSGIRNTATGVRALFSNNRGDGNTAVGYTALYDNITGDRNVAVGYEAGRHHVTGSGNVYIGATMLGVDGEADHTYIRNIKDTTVSGSNTDTVAVNLTTGLLGHLSSSRRYKEDIKPMDKASEAVLALKPVTYRYKKDIDPTQSPAFGLIAEEVARVNPDLVARNSKGEPESVHYEMVNAMLLNEFLKEHRKVEQLEKQVEQLSAGLQKLSTQLEMSKSAPQTVLNNQ